LRTLLIVLTLFCIWLGWHVREARMQEAAIKTLVAVAPRIEYAHQFTRQGIPDRKRQPIWPNWLLELFGHDLFLRVVGVSFDGIKDATDADLRPLVGLTRLRRLDLEYTAVTDEGLEFISEHFPNLTRLDLQVTQISGDGLKYVATLSNLRILLLGECDLSAEHLAYLQSLANLENLAIRFSTIDEGGLKNLTALRGLKSLDLRYTRLTDAAVVPLSQMSNLKELTLTTNNGLALDSIEQLKSALPRCKIEFDAR
jgi:hypothetical protein